REVRLHLGLVPADRVHQCLAGGDTQGRRVSGEIETTEAPRCAVCGRTGTIEQRGVRDALYGVPGRWDYRRCDDCGLLWQDPMVTEAAIGAIYTRYYTHALAASAAPNFTRRLYASIRVGYLANQ